MGLLDDAIREHLELLRRRGADPTEIARAEAEALSPAVREVSEPEAASEEGDLPAGTEPVPAPEIDEFDESLDETAPPAEPDDRDPSDDDDPSGVDQPTAHFDAFPEGADAVAEEVALEEEDLDDPALRAPDAALDDEDDDDLEFEPASGEVVIEGQQELLADDPPTAEGAPADGDVLEGTPDFLEDSPDHDKLWFEQSGPKDFDFDGDDRR